MLRNRARPCRNNSSMAISVSSRPQVQEQRAGNFEGGKKCATTKSFWQCLHSHERHTCRGVGRCLDGLRSDFAYFGEIRTSDLPVRSSKGRRTSFAFCPPQCFETAMRQVPVLGPFNKLNLAHQHLLAPPGHSPPSPPSVAALRLDISLAN